jgi:hypothetical protein
MLPRAHVVPRSPCTIIACIDRLTPAQSYQRQSSAASGQLNMRLASADALASRHALNRNPSDVPALGILRHFGRH